VSSWSILGDKLLELRILTRHGGCSATVFDIRHALYGFPRDVRPLTALKNAA
jgi:hypothetical protein